MTINEFKLLVAKAKGKGIVGKAVLHKMQGLTRRTDVMRLRDIKYSTYFDLNIKTTTNIYKWVSRDELARALRVRRVKLGITQQQAADIAGMIRVSYGMIERSAVSNLPYYKLKDICKALKCHPSDFISYDNQIYSV